MKRLLCYGDSNTWGQTRHQVGLSRRIATDRQWPQMMQHLLLNEYTIIQEGLGGRVAGDFDTGKPYRNGKTSYEVILRSAAPVDLVIIALGTNDLKVRYERTAAQIVDDLEWYVAETQRITPKFGIIPKVIFLLPPNFDPQHFNAKESERQRLMDEMKKSGQLCIEPPHLELTDDGVHFTEEDHKLIAKTISTTIRQLEESNEI